MDYAYDPALVALSIATAILGAFTGLVVTAGIGRASAFETAMRIVLAAAGIGSGIWATHFISVTAVALPIAPETLFPHNALPAAIIVAAGAFAFAIPASGWCGWAAFPLASLVLMAGIAGMYFVSFEALGFDTASFSDYGLAAAMAIVIQTSAAILWFSFHNRALFASFLAAAALGLAISAANYSMLEAVAHPRADGLLTGPAAAADYSLAFSVAGAVYAICGLCIGIFALASSLKRAADSGRQVTNQVHYPLADHGD